MKNNGAKSTSPETRLPKCPTGHPKVSTKLPTAVCPAGGPRWCVAARAVARRCWPRNSRARRIAVRRAGRVHGLRGDGSGVEGQRCVARIRFGGPDPTQKRLWSTTSTSSAVRSRRAASMTWKGCSSGSITRSIPSAPSAWCWTRWKRLFASLPNEAVLRAELPPALPLAQGKRRDRRHHGRTRARSTDAPRAGGIRVRLRHPSRSSGQ